MITLPPTRDLPPHRHAQIRAELAAATRRRPDRRRLVPVLAAAAGVLAVVGVVAWLGPARRTEPVEAGAAPTTKPASTTTAGPTIPGLSTKDIREIERGCGQVAFGAGNNPPTPGVVDTRDTVRLYNLIHDQAGRLALLYGQRSVLDCSLDWPGMPYNSGFAGFPENRPAPDPITIDVTGGMAGGDIPGNKAIYRGMLGNEVVGGRISNQVAKVTVTQGSQTIVATLANGTYLARIVHPSTWKIPNNYRIPVVRAYDTHGTLLATLDHR